MGHHRFFYRDACAASYGVSETTPISGLFISSLTTCFRSCRSIMAENRGTLDDPFDLVASPSQISLTQLQRDRIAEQKKLALARRSANGLARRDHVDLSRSVGESDCSGSERLVGSLEGIKNFYSTSAPTKESVSETTQHSSLHWGIRAVTRIGSEKENKRLSAHPYEIVDVEGDGLVDAADRKMKNDAASDPLCVDSDDAGQGETRNVKARTKSPPNFLRFRGRGGWRTLRKRSSPGQSIRGEGFSDQRNANEYNVQDAGNLRPKFSLSQEQRKVLSAIASGKSVFMTGSAGTGKSYLLEYAVKILKYMHGSSSVFVTASTGLAACAIGGTTLHSFSGIGLGMGDKKVLVDKARSKRDVRKRWMEAKVLIIDEISMIDGQLFDKLEYVARAIRGQAKVFGGVQLVVTGDFFQLPPVNPENPDKYFAFEADCWDNCFDLQIELTQVFRQADSVFVDMLNELRTGHCSPSTQARLEDCNRPVEISDTGILMTKLYPHKVDVSRENEQSLRFLNKETVKFIAKDEGKSDFAKRQLENVRAEKVLHLSVGAQVMLVKNVDTSVGLVNGARGVVVRFTSLEDPDAQDFKDLAKTLSPSGLWPVVLFACDGLQRVVRPESWSITEGMAEVAKRSQIPLSLAWALSVHKCQGMTLDRVETDLSRSFEYGMIYVALSRVKCLRGLRLLGFDASRIKVHSNVVQFYDKLKSGEFSTIKGES